MFCAFTVASIIIDSSSKTAVRKQRIRTINVAKKTSVIRKEQNKIVIRVGRQARHWRLKNFRKGASKTEVKESKL